MKYSNIKGKTLELIASENKVFDALAATVNGRLRELSYHIENEDVDIQFLNLLNSDVVKIYEATLRYVYAMALHKISPKALIKFSYSISRSILGIVKDPFKDFDDEYLEALNEEVKNIIARDLVIKRKTIEIDEAIKMYTTFNMLDKVDILKYREEDSVNTYECDGYFNYMFGYMLTRTSYLKDYETILYDPGFLIRYPRAEVNGTIPLFVEERVFASTLRDAAHFESIVNGDTIAKINDYSSTKDSIIDFVNICEARHNHMLSEIGNKILENKDIRLVAIAGPSSSGKTTFTNRVRIELLSRGLKPVMISIDNYYFGKDFAPKDKDGQPDLEHINALDVKLFNKNISDLIHGKVTTLPLFNFKTGKREAGKTVKLDKNSPILIEGIHALNEDLTLSIPRYQKFKIYIAPQTQIHIDNHNPISITDLRLIRRMVRDYRTRGASLEDTLSMWKSVRAGEFKWIYPNQNDADYVFNSELTYEIAVLKKQVEPGLKKISRDSKYFINANHLIKFLKYFRDIPDELVPNNSILREFIGGSPFHD
jgi:uridine kinase